MLYAALFITECNAYNCSQSSLRLRFIPEVSTGVASSSTSSAQTQSFPWLLIFQPRKPLLNSTCLILKPVIQGMAYVLQIWNNNVRPKSSSVAISSSISLFHLVWPVRGWRSSLFSGFFWRKQTNKQNNIVQNVLWTYQVNTSVSLGMSICHLCLKRVAWKSSVI